jgi:pyrroloquinoline-quinone synthase
VLEVVARYSMLAHGFYQDWMAGRLVMDDLRYYAAQWIHVERHFTRFLSHAHTQCDDPAARQVIAQNLYEEEGDVTKGCDSHLQLWRDYAAELGVEGEIPAGPRTQALIDCYLQLCSRRGWRDAVAAMYAYESQIPEVAQTKLDSLRANYGITSERALRFFRLHAEVDKWHSQAWEGLMDRYTDDEVRSANGVAEQACRALLGFLDGMNEYRMAQGRLSVGSAC